MSADDMVALLSRSQIASLAVDLARRSIGGPGKLHCSFFGEIPRLFLGQTAGVSVFGDKWRTGFCRFELIRPPLLLVRLWQSARLFRELASVRPLASSRVYRSTLVRSLNPLNVGVQ